MNPTCKRKLKNAKFRDQHKHLRVNTAFHGVGVGKINAQGRCREAKDA